MLWSVLKIFTVRRAPVLASLPTKLDWWLSARHAYVWVAVATSLLNSGTYT